MVRRALARAVSARPSLLLVFTVARALLLGSALTGCAASHGGAGHAPSAGAGDAGAASGPLPVPVVAWEDHDVQPLEQPRAVAGLSVGLERRSRSDSGASLVARSPRTGRPRWAVPASAGYVPDGFGLDWSVVGAGADRRIALLRPHPDPDRSDLADLVLVRPSDGRTTVVRGATGFTSFPRSCSGGRVCVSAFPPGDLAHVHRASAPVTAARPRLRFDPDRAAGARQGLGSKTFLVRPGSFGHEELEGVTDGRVRWRRSVTSVFGPNAFAGYAYGFDRAGTVLWGSLLTRPVRRDGELQRDLSRVPTAAFDPRTGRTAWRRFGVSTYCSPAQVPLVAPGEKTHGDDHAVWCRVTGVVHYGSGGTMDRARAVRATGEHLRVESFDPATGRADGWSIALRDADRILSGHLDLPRAGVASVVLRTTDGERVVDLRTGEERRLRRHETFLCSGATKLGSWPAARHRDTGELWRACDARSRRLPVIDPRLVPAVAEPIRGTYVLATVNGLIAYRSPAGG